ncbi:MAG: LPS export ABC transporter periplasmic protein LptC [Holosporaceae bacterium]|nr:LPS export ABC transporter periplasmic protein LptC [Holosporaceae bacterium]
MRRRRTRIKIIAIIFAAIAIAMLTGLLVYTFNTRDSNSEIFKLSENINANVFSKISYRTYDSNGKEITLSSEKVTEEQKNNYVFQQMTSNFSLSSGEDVSVSADITKLIREDKTICEFIGNVKLSTSSGLLLKTEKAVVDFGKKTADGNTEIFLEKDNVRLSANNYHLDIENKIAILNGNARGISDKHSISCNKMTVHFAGDMKNLSDAKSIKSINAEGNAKCTSPNYTLTAQKNILYTGESIVVDTHVNLVYKKEEKAFDIKSGHMIATLKENNTIKEVKATKYLTIKTPDAIIRSNRGILRDNKISAFGDVVISSADGDVFGDTAVFDIDTGSIFIDKSSGIVSDGKRK